MNGNDFMAWLLRSPLHTLLSSHTMLITVTGKKTGKPYTTPVDYYSEGGYLWVISSRSRTWWRNLKGGANVNILLKRKPYGGFAEVELDEAQVKSRMLEYLKRMPQAMRPLGIRVENNAPNMDDVVRVAKERLFVKIKLSA